MQLDRRVPAVYIDIEDQSHMGIQANLPRSAYCVIISDRGPHNRVVNVTNWTDFVTLFGQPDYTKTGHAHYLCYNHLLYSNQLYVTRVAPSDATLSNVAIKYNNPTGSSELLTGNFSFTNGSTNVVTDVNGIININVGDLVYSQPDSYLYAQKVVSISSNSTTNQYSFTLQNPYQGTTTLNVNLFKYYPGTYLFNGTYIFNTGSNVVLAPDSTSLSSINIGDWVYSQADSFANARQVIDIDIYNKELTLDAPYANDSTSNLEKYIPFQLVSTNGVTTDDELLQTDVNNLWYFYAKGVGAYYNNIYIMGVRDVEYETIFVDNYGNPLYKYAFMDIAVYEKQSDGTMKILEGPWVVSLLNKTINGDTVRSIVTGEELYIETIINKYSKIISCKSASATNVLLTSPDAELKRLQVLSIFSQGQVLKLNTLGENGFSLADGSNGSQYTANGMLDLESNLILRGLVAQAYNGTLQSVDGSVQNITQSIYPWYIFSYVYCGGYDSIIANSARELVDLRGDCLLLSDTGGYYITADTELNARKISVPWNTYNAMLYAQFRTYDDIFTGKTFYISPVFDAIERHLYVDGMYWYAEPVANIEKGALSRQTVLAYKPNLTKTGDLIDAEVNPTITEPDGTYIISQLTTYKRLSILKRAHAVKFIHYLYHTIPPLLKDIIQRKGTKYWIDQAYIRVNNHMQQFLDNGVFDKYAAVSSYQVSVSFDDTLSELTVLLSMKILRAIERITVRIVVT